jgi:flagellar biogenesis protein FliO
MIVGPVVGFFMGLLLLLIKIAFVIGLVWLVMYLLRRRSDDGDQTGKAPAE